MTFRDRVKAAFSEAMAASTAADRHPVRGAPRSTTASRSRLPLIQDPDLDRPAARDDLPASFDVVLQRRRPEAGCSRRTWSADDPSGNGQGINFTDAWQQLPRESWPATADVLLLRLAQRFRGYTPIVFGDQGPLLFPGIQRLSEQVLAQRNFEPLALRDCRSSHVGAIGFGRLRTPIRWRPFPDGPCPLCGALVDPEAHWESTVLTYGPPRWCRRCMQNAYGTACASTDEAFAAVRHYTDLTGEPPDRRYGVQQMPQGLSGTERDALLAARMALPFPGHLKKLGIGPWPQMLATAGVARDRVVTARGIQSAADDGHW